METKNNPGPDSCYAKADPDEPMFILLGRDPEAALTVRFWAALRLARLTREAGASSVHTLTEEQQAQPRQAFAAARQMQEYCNYLRGPNASQTFADSNVLAAVAEPRHGVLPDPWTRLRTYLHRVDPQFRASLGGMTGTEMREAINRRFGIIVPNMRLDMFVEVVIAAIMAQTGIPEIDFTPPVAVNSSPVPEQGDAND